MINAGAMQRRPAMTKPGGGPVKLAARFRLLFFLAIGDK